MILHRHCPLCKSSDLRGYALDTIRTGPHISRVRCEKCALVFANPMADAQELEKYYTEYYDKAHYHAVDYKKHVLDHFYRIADLKETEIKREARYLNNLVYGGGEFLDIGCGLGLGLAYAHQFGYKLYATEFDRGALEFVGSHFPVNSFQGDLWGANYPDSFFDFIHISHVIEHVLDPRGYIQEMKRILKPGGYMAIGTPNMSSNLYRVHRWTKLLQLQLPDVIDGLEHTFIFPEKLLAEVCLEEGLKIEDHYTHGLGEKIGNLLRYKMPLKKKLNRLVQNFFQVNQWIVCKK